MAQSEPSVDEPEQALVVQRKRATTRKHVLAVASKAVDLLLVLAAKRPSLVPILQSLQNLITPSNDHVPASTRVVLNRIRKLNKKLEKATDEDQVKIRRKLEALHELLIDDDDDA